MASSKADFTICPVALGLLFEALEFQILTYENGDQQVVIIIRIIVVEAGADAAAVVVVLRDVDNTELAVSLTTRSRGWALRETQLDQRLGSLSIGIAFAVRQPDHQLFEAKRKVTPQRKINGQGQQTKLEPRRRTRSLCAKVH